MKKIIKGFLVFTSLTFGNPSFAEYSIFGVGTMTCAEFTETHDQVGKIPTYEQWLLGLFTGLNAANDYYGAEGSTGNNVHRAIYAAVLKYCRDNPLRDVSTAALITYSELR